MSEIKNIDDTLTKVMNDQMNVTPDPIPQVEAPDQVEAPQEREAEVSELPSENALQDQKNVPQEATDQKANHAESPIDEYGNPIEKPKMYSEDEVQKMIRDRLSRGRHAEQPTPQQIQNDAKNFTPDPESEDSWEVQLEGFIEKTIEKRQAKLSEQQWRQQEAAKQVEFETKFSNGMNKYQDFHEVVSGKPITDSMMLATRNLENPAAFIYGAAKMHPQELERISRIADPYAQASEIGRLHEKMVKERKVMSAAAKPLESPRGDMPARVINQPSLEDRIQQYAKQKRK